MDTNRRSASNQSAPGLAPAELLAPQEPPHVLLAVNRDSIPSVLALDESHRPSPFAAPRGLGNVRDSPLAKHHQVGSMMIALKSHDGLILLALAVAAGAESASGPRLCDSPGPALVTAYCSACHGCGRRFWARSWPPAVARAESASAAPDHDLSQQGLPRPPPLPAKDRKIIYDSITAGAPRPLNSIVSPNPRRAFARISYSPALRPPRSRRRRHPDSTVTAFRAGRRATAPFGPRSRGSIIGAGRPCGSDRSPKGIGQFPDRGSPPNTPDDPSQELALPGVGEKTEVDDGRGVKGLRVWTKRRKEKA